MDQAETDSIFASGLANLYVFSLHIWLNNFVLKIRVAEISLIIIRLNDHGGGWERCIPNSNLARNSSLRFFCGLIKVDVNQAHLKTRKGELFEATKSGKNTILAVF